jgi:hypothetical protein
MRIERLGLSRPGAISRASPLQRLGALCYCGLEYNPAAAGSARESAQCSRDGAVRLAWLRLAENCLASD